MHESDTGAAEREAVGCELHGFGIAFFPLLQVWPDLVRGVLMEEAAHLGHDVRIRSSAASTYWIGRIDRGHCRYRMLHFSKLEKHLAAKILINGFANSNHNL